MLLGIKKKIMAAGKRAACNEDLVKAKWLSVLNHVCDIHEGHSDLFPACEHGPLEPRWWLKKGVNKKLLYLYIFHMNTYF